MSVPLDLVDGFVPAGTEVDGPAELEALLSHWVAASNRPTVADTGAFGGSPAISVRMGPDEFVLNRDTKREAVQAFLAAAARAAGASNLRWHVTANRNGKLNRVSYRPDDAPTPGWYAYTREPYSGPRELGFTAGRRPPTSARTSRPSGTRDSPTGDSRQEVSEMSGAAYIVQFPHPGGEHEPSGPIMPWNAGPHARKFMQAEATYRDERSREQRGKVVFWGEWEPPSRILRRWPRREGLPRVLHEPYFEAPPTTGFRQNTDPWVFGGTFYYSNCKQRTNKGRSATAMQRLTPGSLILFGSSIDNEFVLDTAFVVGKRLGSFVPGLPVDLDVDDVFRIATIESLITSMVEEEQEQDQSFTLYEGATASQPIHGMFSFLPCLPHDADGPRFARPVIRLPGIVNPQSKQATRGSSHPREVDEVVRVWKSVVSQVVDQDLVLATRIGAL